MGAALPDDRSKLASELGAAVCVLRVPGKQRNACTVAARRVNRVNPRQRMRSLTFVRLAVTAMHRRPVYIPSSALTAGAARWFPARPRPRHRDSTRPTIRAVRTARPSPEASIEHRPSAASHRPRSRSTHRRPRIRAAVRCEIARGRTRRRLEIVEAGGPIGTVEAIERVASDERKIAIVRSPYRQTERQMPRLATAGERRRRPCLAIPMEQVHVFARIGPRTRGVEVVGPETPEPSHSQRDPAGGRAHRHRCEV